MSSTLQFCTRVGKSCENVGHRFMLWQPACQNAENSAKSSKISTVFWIFSQICAEISVFAIYTH